MRARLTARAGVGMLWLTHDHCGAHLTMERLRHLSEVGRTR
jgi:hypothetical protein